MGVDVSQSKLASQAARRTAPHGEWVEMYRRGISPSRIAVVDAAPVTTVRYHLQVAKKLEPESMRLRCRGLRDRPRRFCR